MAPPRLPDMMEDWSQKDVCSWLQYIGYGQYVRNFRDEEVDGEVLMELGNEALAQLGIPTLGRRIGLLRRVAQYSRRPLLGLHHAAAYSMTSLPLTSHYSSMSTMDLTNSMPGRMGSLSEEDGSLRHMSGLEDRESITLHIPSFTTTTTSSSSSSSNATSLYPPSQGVSRSPSPRRRTLGGVPALSSGPKDTSGQRSMLM